MDKRTKLMIIAVVVVIVIVLVYASLSPSDRAYLWHQWYRYLEFEGYL